MIKHSTRFLMQPGSAEILSSDIKKTFGFNSDFFYLLAQFLIDCPHYSRPRLVTKTEAPS